MKLKILALLISFFLISPVFAHDKYIMFPVKSYHMDRSAGECETNPGIEYQHFISNTVYLAAGVFKNSACNLATTWFVGWESYKERHIFGIPYGFGFSGGGVTGYKHLPTHLPIIGMPYIRFGNRNDKINIKVMVIPHPTKGVFGFGITRKLGKRH